MSPRGGHRLGALRSVIRPGSPVLGPSQNYRTRKQEKFVGARQLVRQDGGSGDPFYGAQPLQPTQTRAPTGERLQNFLALESWCAKIGGIHKIGQMLFRSTALWGGGFAYLIDKKARRMHLPIVPVGRHTMRATDGLQTTITLGSVKPHGQAFALELALEISLPMPRQDE